MNRANGTQKRDAVTVWDLPTRLFHWVLVALIVLQYASGELGLFSMDWHFCLGYATLALIVFRVLWGFFGSTTSRFPHFVRGPLAVWRYTVALLQGRAHGAIGHNPLGGWSVLVMLASVALQSVTGLFSTDDLETTGPLAARVSEATVKWMTRIHHWNRYVLLLLIVLHLAAVLAHWVWRRDNLVAPMVHGRKRIEVTAPMRAASPWIALALLAVSALAVWALVAWGEAA
jgi:cytochrome b